MTPPEAEVTGGGWDAQSGATPRRATPTTLPSRTLKLSVSAHFHDPKSSHIVSMSILIDEKHGQNPQGIDICHSKNKTHFYPAAFFFRSLHSVSVRFSNRVCLFSRACEWKF